MSKHLHVYMYMYMYMNYLQEYVDVQSKWYSVTCTYMYSVHRIHACASDDCACAVYSSIVVKVQYYYHNKSINFSLTKPQTA